ncbi:hypothetical protein RM545_13800 [Zunongwangia sp. F260]|uniref:Uncharacterized protein n=1 Tax=Autumnicola lenta TaxID=3075593 RepID=A0ABU3CN41_9FLAO|nr:hypothetical protein [Zunongwangia sp. F260]MDT0647769.1 hypothetical protein [Zunongwangia sp. F260]
MGFAPYVEMIPGVVIINQIHPFTPCFMTNNGLKVFAINMEELKGKKKFEKEDCRTATEIARCS